MRVFFDKYKSIILPALLLLIFALRTALTWGKWGHIIYDCFREAVIPQALLDGKVLYRDITNLYPPLGYQFNAFLFLIFGNSLNVLYWAGVINSLLILSVIYLIAKKYSSDLFAFIAVLSVMEIFVFKVSALNCTSSWFFPYSYSFIYAFSSCLISLLAYVLYKENQKPLFLYLSLLFIGLSIAFKLDFIPFLIIPVFGLVKYIVKNRTPKAAALGVFCIIFPFVLSILIYLFTGGTLSDLQSEVKFLKDFSHTPSVITFNRSIMPQWFKLWVLKKVFISFKYFMAVSTVIFLYTYVSVFVVLKLKKIFPKVILGVFLFWFGYTNIISIIAAVQFRRLELLTDLAFVSYFVTISAIGIVVSKIVQNKGFKNIEFTRYEKFYFFIIFCAFLLSFRSFALLYLVNVGGFVLPLWWFAFIYFFLKLCPEYFPGLFNKQKFKTALSLFFIVYSLYFVYIYVFDAKRMTNKVTSTKGTYYNAPKFVHTANETIKFINEEIPKDKTFLVSEEGLVFNYLTEREANLKYYALIPHMIETYGEDNIIADLAKNPPDYFLITNNLYVTKAGGAFGIHYARKIAGFIVQNYDYIKTIKNPDVKDSLEITIFRIKENLQ